MKTTKILFWRILIATLIDNGESLDKILKSADEIEDKKERESVKKIMSTIFLNFIELNPEFSEFIKKHTTQSP